MRHEDFLIHAKALIWDINQTRDRLESMERVYELRNKSLNNRLAQLEEWMRTQGGDL